MPVPVPAYPRSQIDSYLIRATPRTGSTLLCGLLASTGVTGRPESFFRSQGPAGIPLKPWRLRLWCPRFGGSQAAVSPSIQDNAGGLCPRGRLLSSKDLSRAHAFYRTVGFGAVAEGFRADLRNWPEPALKRDER